MLNHREIFYHYIRKWFIFDLICAFPYIIFFDDEKENYLGMIRLLRVFRLLSLSKKMTFLYRLSAVIRGVISLVKLSFSILIVGHWCACIWYYVGRKE